LVPDDPTVGDDQQYKIGIDFWHFKWGWTGYRFI